MSKMTPHPSPLLVKDRETSLIVRDYQPADEKAVLSLWKRCNLGAHKDPVLDIAIKLRAGNGWLLIGDLRGEVVATAMVGYDGHRGWINYLAVSPDHQHGGYGRQIMARAEELLRGEGCPKINLQVRKSNLGVLDFYRKLGFAEDEVVSLGKRLI